MTPCCADADDEDYDKTTIDTATTTANDIDTGKVRYPDKDFFDLPNRMGQIKDINKFDNMFFGISASQADSLDPQIRMLLESVYEAIVDAGYSMEDLASSNTGVYVGGGFSDLHKALLTDMCKKDDSNCTVSGYENTGGCFTMFSNRISFCFDFTGPSISIDTACSSSLVAFDQAIKDINSGVITRAIVGGVSLVTDPSKYINICSSGVCVHIYMFIFKVVVLVLYVYIRLSDIYSYI